MSSSFVEIWNVTKAYDTPAGRQVVVKDFNLKIEEGEFVCLIGHSGCGKSTVLSMVAGLSPLSGGGIILAGREIEGPGPDRGMVFQTPCLLPWMTALENVMLGVDEVHARQSPAERREIAARALARVGLSDALHKKSGALSQGMKQRVGLARAFALSPRMFLLDEPFGMLDSLTRLDLQQLVVELQAQERKTVLMVTHDVDEALFLADRIVMMTQGPEARVGHVIPVPFRRPRDRAQLLENPDYYVLRERLLGLLDEDGISPLQVSSRTFSPEVPASVATLPVEGLRPAAGKS